METTHTKKKMPFNYYYVLGAAAALVLVLGIVIVAVMMGQRKSSAASQQKQQQRQADIEARWATYKSEEEAKKDPELMAYFEGFTFANEGAGAAKAAPLSSVDQVRGSTDM